MKRELFAFVAGPIVIAAIVWLPAWVFLAVLTVAALLAGDELLRMARASGIRTGRWAPGVCLAGVLVAAWLGASAGLAAALAGAALVLPVVQLWHPERPTGSLAGTATACLTVLYVGVTAASLGWLRQWPGDPAGVRLLLFFMVVIWIGDSGAYYLGRRFGRRRMSPRISPNKTWEGLAGGTAATVLAALVAMPVLEALIPGGGTVVWGHTVAMALILAVAAPVGDLIESQFKRDSGQKDSSALLPGHGGVLDRTDSLFFAAPPILGYLLLAGLVP